MMTGVSPILGTPHVATPKHDGILMNSLILDDLAGIRII